MSSTQNPYPPLASVETITRRLGLIFPDGTPNRVNAVAERAAKTAFVLLYVGAVEGTGRWARPDQVTRMSDVQAAKTKSAERADFAKMSLRKLGGEITGRWYSVNSREGIRDDTLRYAWQPLGAVVEKPGLATTSSTPRWALAADFAAILTWGIDCGSHTEKAALERDAVFVEMISTWQSVHLTSEARARIQVMRRVTGTSDAVPVTLPDGSIRKLAYGDSSIIVKAFVEQFAARFLKDPAILWLSESREHVSVRDDALAKSIGLDISNSGILPDVILVDTNPKRLLLVFCEVVATDGPMNELRKADILKLTGDAGFSPANIALVTAFLDRSMAPYRKLISTLAWGSFSWTASEPDKLTLHVDAVKNTFQLSDALDLMNGKAG
jgi:hypothetical protein